MRANFDKAWRKVADEVLVGMKEWRLAHPRATFQEIERELDEELSKLRVQMLKDTAMASKAADVAQREKKERADCPECGEKVQAKGKQTRRLTSQSNRVVEIERSYGVCPQCKAGFFPSG